MTPLSDKLSNIHHYGIDIDNREIFLHSYVAECEEEPGVDYRSAVAFEKNIRYLNSISSEPIIVHMHMPGGYWSDCLGMFDSVTLSKSPIGFIVYSKAESASGVLLQSAKLRILMPNTYMLIHYGSLSVDSEHMAAVSNMKWNESESQKMIDIFVERCIKSPMVKEKKWKRPIVKKHIISQLSSKSDWILSAEEAVYYGFADGVYGHGIYKNIEAIKRKLK
jgi:ATP-dependent protease ClpP protease subunit